MADRTVDGALPAEWWRILEKLNDIGGTTGRLEAKVDAFTVEQARMGHRLDSVDTRVQLIEAEMTARKLQVARFEKLCDQVDDLEDWRTTSTATSSHTSRIFGWSTNVITTMFGAPIVLFLGWVAKAYIG